MTKVLKYFFFVIIGVGIIDGLSSVVLERAVIKGYPKTLGSTCDIAIFGASRAYCHYNPQIISDSLKISANVYGLGGQNIFYHYCMLNSVLDHSISKPRVVLLELNSIDVSDTPQWNTERLNVLFPYYYSESCVRNLFSDILDKEELFIVKVSGLYRHNSRLLSYLRDFICGRHESATTGFVPLKRILQEPIKEGRDYGDHTDSLKVKYIEEFIELCKRENITVFFFVSPQYKILSKSFWKDEVKTIANRHGVPLIDHEQDKIFLEHREWFQDPEHLNETGANIYSQIVAKDLKQLGI